MRARMMNDVGWHANPTPRWLLLRLTSPQSPRSRLPWTFAHHQHPQPSSSWFCQSCYIDFSKVVPWICQNWCMDFSYGSLKEPQISASLNTAKKVYYHSQHLYKSLDGKIVLMINCRGKKWPTVMRFVKKFTPLDFQAKIFTPLISPNFNSFGDNNTKTWVKMEKFTPLAKILHWHCHCTLFLPLMTQCKIMLNMLIFCALLP